LKNINLPTAADQFKIPNEIRQQIARRNRAKGSNYERDIAKKIASYFNWKWDQAFFRTKPHGHAQPNGDLQPINDMYDLWRGAKLGPIECKNRANWTFDQIFKNPEKSELYRYWKKSNDDTNSDNTIVFFTKAGVQDYTMCLSHNIGTDIVNHLSFWIDENRLVIMSLKDFLRTMWPK
jgi:hypothetical protein